MFNVSTRVIIIAVAFVEGCGWYVAEWRDHADRGQRIKLVRNPLGMVARACSRLWTNRRMVWLLVALWVVHLAVLHMLVGVRAKSTHNWIFSAVVPRQAALDTCRPVFPGLAYQHTGTGSFRLRDVIRWNQAA
jgi:hypothetical protein